MKKKPHPKFFFYFFPLPKRIEETKKNESLTKIEFNTLKKIEKETKKYNLSTFRVGTFAYSFCLHTNAIVNCRFIFVAWN